MDKDTAETIGKRVHRYMLRKATPENVKELLIMLKDAGVGIGGRIAFRYAVPDSNNPTLPPRWYVYAVCCPFCRKPTVYFFADFGPGCSGMNGGCGYKVPKEKRPWYTPPNDANRGSAPQQTRKK